MNIDTTIRLTDLLMFGAAPFFWWIITKIADIDKRLGELQVAYDIQVRQRREFHNHHANDTSQSS